GTLAVDCELASGVPAVDGAEAVASTGGLAFAASERALREVAVALFGDLAAFRSAAGFSGSVFLEDVGAGIDASLLASSIAGAALVGAAVDCATAAGGV